MSSGGAGRRDLHGQRRARRPGRARGRRITQLFSRGGRTAEDGVEEEGSRSGGMHGSGAARAGARAGAEDLGWGSRRGWAEAGGCAGHGGRSASVARSSRRAAPDARHDACTRRRGDVARRRGATGAASMRATRDGARAADRSLQSADESPALHHGGAKQRCHRARDQGVREHHGTRVQSRARTQWSALGAALSPSRLAYSDGGPSRARLCADNFRKHAPDDVERHRRLRQLDPFSSAAWFDGWDADGTLAAALLRGALERRGFTSCTAAPTTFLLTRGYLRRGTIRFAHVPSSRTHLARPPAPTSSVSTRPSASA